MRNGVIKNSALVRTQEGLAIQLSIGFIENNKEKELATQIIEIKGLDEIKAILTVANTAYWEELKGSSIQFEEDEDKIIKIANFLDNNISIQLITNEANSKDDEITSEDSEVEIEEVTE